MPPSCLGHMGVTAGGATRSKTFNLNSTSLALSYPLPHAGKGETDRPPREV